MPPILILNDKEQSSLHALASSSCKRNQKLRCEIILAATAPRASIASIASSLGASRATVRHWLDQYRSHGIGGLMDKPRTGAPRQIDEATRTAILSLHQDGHSTRTIAARLDTSQSTISRILRETRDHSTAEPAITKLVEQLAVDLFESLSDDEPLIRFISRLKRETGSDYGVILISPHDRLKPSLILSEGKTLQGTLPYIEKYHRDEVMVGLPEGVVTTTSDLMPPEQFRKTELYQKFLADYGVTHVLGVNIGSVRGISGGLRLSRLEKRGNFSPRVRAICQGLVPFIRVAFNLFVQRVDMEIEKQALARTVSGISMGSILVGPDGQILEANPPAIEILNQRDGIMVNGDRIALHDGKQSKLLLDLIRRNAQVSGTLTDYPLSRAIRVHRPSGKEGISLLVRPVSNTGPSRFTIRPRALIHLVDPSQPRQPIAKSLGELFGLSPAEARVALSLSNGLSVTETAHLCNTTRNTVRSQVRSIFAKMGISSQSELVRTTLINMALLS